MEHATSLMTSARRTTGSGRTQASTRVSCPGGTTAIRLPAWPTGQHWWTTTPGTTATSHWWVRPCRPMRAQPMRS
uniref:Uncharacterized protein n=1 Tax=Anguilla anguilla TaxID=7936 RepID=A0A0E9WZW4_ANGAN